MPACVLMGMCGRADWLQSAAWRAGSHAPPRLENPDDVLFTILQIDSLQDGRGDVVCAASKDVSALSHKTWPAMDQ